MLSLINKVFSSHNHDKVYIDKWGIVRVRHSNNTLFSLSTKASFLLSLIIVLLICVIYCE